MNPSTTLPLRRFRLATLLLVTVLAGGCAGSVDQGRATGGSATTLPSPTTSVSSPADGPLQGAPATVSPNTGPRATPAAPSGSPAAAASESTAPAATPVAPAEPFVMGLYHSGDFVAQYTFEWCVGASLQMALRITGASDDRSRAYQQELWEMARDRSFSPFGGANPRGWTAALNDLGIGPYELVSLPSFDEAVRTAAAAIRATERPVGLVMWRGRHAWVMSGFESIGDPAIHDDFTVTGIRVLDPLHPHGSGTWGPSPAPNALITPETLATQFVLRDSTRVNLGVPAGYLVVLPVAAA